MSSDRVYLAECFVIVRHTYKLSFKWERFVVIGIDYVQFYTNFQDHIELKGIT